MSKEKIGKLRDAFLKCTEKFVAEQEKINDIRNRPLNERIGGLLGYVCLTDNLLYEMCQLGIAGAGIRKVSSERIKKLMKELETVSKKCRANLNIKNIEKALFFMSQFKILQGRIFRSVLDILRPEPLYTLSKMESILISTRNVFIVHGRDYKPMQELKKILYDLGLNPIVLHEQPSGSRTIIEKLEKYSDVGYAFVILTPDDLGTSDEQFNKYNQNFVEELAKFRNGKQTEDETKKRLAENAENFIENRARQNVILEFGYFIGKLDRDGVSGRDRVCCLLKGDVERPSDMHGIVYIPFKESVNEVRDKIVKELKAVGYEIKIQ